MTELQKTIQSWLVMHPDWSSRQIAKKVGCSKSTVQAVRDKTAVEVTEDFNFSQFSESMDKLEIKPVEKTNIYNFGKPIRILMIPDCQVKPGVNTDHLEWAGKAILDYKPDVIVNIGDFADMPSLSTHDKVGSKYYEGKRYKEDIDSVKAGMKRLLAPLRQYQAENSYKADADYYNPLMILTMGNHENRINRAVNNNPFLEGVISTDDLGYDNDWIVHDFLKPVFINGVGFNHYFPVGVMDRPASSPQVMINKLHMSCIAGHQQGKAVAYGKKADGSAICAIIAGSFYTHSEDYMSQLGNSHWRGLVMLNEVENGSFDEMFLSMRYLESKYGN